MDAAQDPNPIAITDPGGNVAINLPCLICGYDICGLPVSGNCPECATAVGYSLRGRQLRFSDLTWVKRLTRGATLLITAIAAAVLGAIAFQVYTIITVFPAMQRASSGTATPFAIGTPPFATAVPTLPIGLMVAMYLFHLIVAAVATLGYWFVTAPDPGSARWGGRARVISRWCALALPIWMAGNALVNGANLAMNGGNPLPVAPGLAFGGLMLGWAILGGILGLIGSGIAPLALIRYFQPLMLRAARPKLARFCLYQFWSTVVVGVVLAAGYALLLVAMLPLIQAGLAAGAGPGATTLPTTLPGSGTVVWRNTTPIVVTNPGAAPGAGSSTSASFPTSTPTSGPAAAMPFMPGFGLSGSTMILTFCSLGVFGCLFGLLMISGFVLLCLVRGALGVEAQAGRMIRG